MEAPWYRRPQYVKGARCSSKTPFNWRIYRREGNRLADWNDTYMIGGNTTPFSRPLLGLYQVDPGHHRPNTWQAVERYCSNCVSSLIQTCFWVKHSASVKGAILAKVQDRKLNRKPRPLWVRLTCSSNQSIWTTLKGPVAWQLSHHFQVWHLSSIPPHPPAKNSIGFKEIAHLALCLQLGFSRQSNLCVWKGDKTRLPCHSVICTVYIFGLTWVFKRKPAPTLAVWGGSTTSLYLTMCMFSIAAWHKDPTMRSTSLNTKNSTPTLFS